MIGGLVIQLGSAYQSAERPDIAPNLTFRTIVTIGTSVDPFLSENRDYFLRIRESWCMFCNDGGWSVTLRQSARLSVLGRRGVLDQLRRSGELP
jgi:hypothetical protein